MIDQSKPSGFQSPRSNMSARRASRFRADPPERAATFFCVIVAGMVLMCAGCSSKFYVEIDNQSAKTVYAGLMERTSAGTKILENVTVAPGDTGEMKVKGSADEERAVYSVMIGDTPSPRDRAIVRRIYKGDNLLTVKQLSPDPKAPISVEAEHD